MKPMKIIRTILSANFLLLFVFAFLPILMIKPDIEIMQIVLEFINKE
ncbi:hypothetical protein JSQ81_04655 [Sporosarcina sp. Marseille-Q4063]|nr:hypothetical protein [Sporosarcina sp. Marseille-Q4063]QUW22874.1 hypothetical protein JSQ81_04655 [Sporosarcina sp. Marseille-Q4063]